MISSAYYRKAIEIVERRKIINEQLLDTKRYDILSIYPEYEKLEKELARTGYALAMCILSKDNVKEKISQIEKENTDIQEKMAEILKKAGKPADYLNETYSCIKCQDTGSYRNARCSCVEALARQLAVKELNESSPLNISSFESFNLMYYSDRIEPTLGVSPRRIMEENLRICKDFADNFRIPCDGLLLTGGTGLGKTHLSLAIAGSVIENSGYSVIYGSAPDMLRKIEREHFSRDFTADTVSLIESCDLLILDDLGAEFESQFYVAEIYKIINTRKIKGLPTIVSTNMNSQQLVNRYTERIVSRLKSMQELFFIGDDIRLKTH